MKLSAWVFVTDLFPKKKTAFDKFIIDRFIRKSIFQKNTRQILLTLKKSGVDGIELIISSNTNNNDIQKIQEMLSQLTIPVFSVHQSLAKMFNISVSEVNRLCEVANRLSAKVVVLHINAIGDQIFDEGYTDDLKALEKQYKIKIAIENMPINPLSIFKTYTWREDEFSSVIKKSGFKITLDSTHLAQAGYDIIDFYKKNKDQITNIHLSDYKKSFFNTFLLLVRNTHLALGKGELPIKDFLQTLKEDQYNGLITMEINGNLEDLCKSAKFIKNIYT